MGWADNFHLHFHTHTYTCHAILLYVLLHFHTDVMLRCCTFSCASTHTHAHTHVTLCSCTFSCTSTQMSCYAAVRSLALPHTHTHTHVTLCSCTFSCTSTQRHATLLYVLCIFFISRKGATFFALHHGASRSPVCGPMVCDTEAVQMERLCPNQGKVSREDEAGSNLTSEERLPEVVPLAAYSCNYGT